MRDPTRQPRTLAARLLRFCLRAVRAFFHNRGLLLAGGVGYNALLSAVPFFAVTATGLSYFVPQDLLLQALASELKLLVPNHSDVMVAAVKSFLDSREVVSVLGMAGLLFFSSIAFRMLEEAIAVIFRVSARVARDPGRRFWVSVLLPYLFIGALILALLGVTLVRTGLDTLGERTLHFFGREVSLAPVSGFGTRVLGFVSMVLLFTSIYKVLPVVRVSLRRAATGGFVAAALWELSGRAMACYFANVSLVGVIYGSLATVIVLLLGLEVASIILLLGAQVIAELEASAAAGVPWHEDPSEK